MDLLRGDTGDDVHAILRQILGIYNANSPSVLTFSQSSPKAFTCCLHSRASQTNPSLHMTTMPQPQKRRREDDLAHEASLSPPRPAKRQDCGEKHHNPVEQEAPHQPPETTLPPTVPLTRRALQTLDAFNSAQQRQADSPGRSPCPQPP